MKLPFDKQKLLDNMTGELKQIAGVRAIVLGGSYAVGSATEDSDLDIGIYYYEQYPFDIKEIKRLAEKYASNERPTVTDFYQWGPWVNGGAWINTANGKVDLLYKNIDQICSTVEKAKNGIWEKDFEQQPPYGFSSIIFLAETQNSLPLHDPDQVVRKLKESVKQYPQKLKQSVIQQSLWSAEFTIWQAEKFASKTDAYTTVGCLTRAVHNLLTALFAMNEIYPMGDKRALSILEQANIKPANLTENVTDILCCTKDDLKGKVELLKKFFEQTRELMGTAYEPYYKR